MARRFSANRQRIISRSGTNPVRHFAGIPAAVQAFATSAARWSNGVELPVLVGAGERPCAVDAQPATASRITSAKVDR